MSKKNIKKVGDVIQINLPNGKYAFGRIFKDAGLGVYKYISDLPNTPPIGLREYFFIVCFQSYPIEKGEVPIVGYDPFENEENSWPPPVYVYHKLFNQYKIYHKAEMRNATKEECEGLETTTIWGIEDIIDRIMGGTKMKDYEKFMF